MTNSVSLRPLKADSKEIEQALKLYVEAFPLCERRDNDKWLACLCDKDKPFVLFGIMCDNTFIGILSCWEFSDFVYVEHFAVNSNARGNGIGAKAMSALKAHYGSTPLVLEVEMPTEEIAIRRIGFYQRQGFCLNDKNYMQPPYRESESWFNLKLMTTDNAFLDAHFDMVRDDIYHKVYNVKD